jgi:4-amino-4-deoxy-L-arabinose transferase-like glycosyltransferase
MRTRLALAVILVAAAALRFTALDWGLRHPPHLDERPFVEAAAAMVAHRDLDHRFYEYPGGFLYLLAGALGLAGRLPPAPAAYLVARAVVAACGVLSAALACRLGTALGGPRAGLLAAALLALSPAEVRVAHMVRPDVVLETLALATLVLCLEVGEDPRRDALAGAAVGAASAVKFSGALVAVAYLARRVVSPGFRGSRLVLAGGAALTAYACLSPYTFVRWHTAITGASTQLHYHYEGHEYLALPWLDTVREYVEVFGRAVGPVGLGLAVAAGWLRRAEWRRFVHVALLPVVMVAVFSSAEVHRLRFMAAGFGAVAVMAALGAESLGGRRSVRVAVVLALLLPPAGESLL